MGIKETINYPWKIVKESIKSVPSVKYALGVTGIISLVSIVASFGIDFRVAFIGALVMMVLMVLLVIFAKLTTTANRYFILPVLVLMWSFLTLSILTSGLLFTSVFFRWPMNLQYWINSRFLIANEVVSPNSAEAAILITDLQSWKLPPQYNFRSLDIILRGVDKSDKELPIDPIAMLFIKDNKKIVDSMKLDVTTVNGEDIRLIPNKSVNFSAHGDLYQKYQSLFSKSKVAVIAFRYDNLINNTNKIFYSNEFTFDTTAIKLLGD